MTRSHRCARCGSPRVISHPELDSLEIAHIDCDAFFASVEKRDNPGLIDQPVIVGGGKRGVVSTCCYIARMYGVRSAMPMFKALKACPHAVVVKPRMSVYSAVGKQIRQAMMELTPMVQPLSIDEAFLDLSGTQRLHKASAAQSLARFVREVETNIGITMSVGLAPNKFLAKIASDLEKPRGFSIIGSSEAKEFLADKPTSIIWGVGKVLQRKLAENGLQTVGQLQQADPSMLARTYGAMGLRLAKLCQGEDDRSVTQPEKAKSISNEVTFNYDISSYKELSATLWLLAQKVSDRAKGSATAGRTVALKLKDENFKTISRSRHLGEPTQLADIIFRVADALLQPETQNGRRYRLIGVGIADLEPTDGSDPQDLLDNQASKRASAERAMDDLRNRFGDKSVTMGRGLKTK